MITSSRPTCACFSRLLISWRHWNETTHLGHFMVLNYLLYHTDTKRYCHVFNMHCYTVTTMFLHWKRIPGSVGGSCILPKALPDLSRRQIQDKVARGEIRHMQFRQSLETRREKRARKTSNSANRDGKSTGTLAGDGGYTYFSSIRDLTNKIMGGKAGKSVSLSWKASQNQSEKPIKSFSDLVCPSFVSPKKVKEERKSMFTSSYAPPLLPTVCQSAEPAFFAGSDIPYKLRERLPEKLFLDSNEDFDWLLSWLNHS